MKQIHKQPKKEMRVQMVLMFDEHVVKAKIKVKEEEEEMGKEMF